MDLQTHLSSRESSGTLIQIIHVWSESLEVWDDKLLSEGLSEQDNVALNAPDEQTTNNMAKNTLTARRWRGKFANQAGDPEVWQTSVKWLMKLYPSMMHHVIIG